MKWFALINTFFIALFIYLSLNPPSLLGWTLFIAIWFAADGLVVRYTGMDLSWQMWVLLLMGLSILDVAILYFTGAW